jgi:hypothetical protein
MINRRPILTHVLFALLTIGLALFVEMWLFGEPFSWGTVIIAAVASVILIKVLERVDKARQRRQG